MMRAAPIFRAGNNRAMRATRDDTTFRDWVDARAPMFKFCIATRDGFLTFAGHVRATDEAAALAAGRERFGATAEVVGEGVRV